MQPPSSASPSGRQPARGATEQAARPVPPPGVVSGAASLPYVTPGIGAQSFAELDEALDSLPSQPSARSGAELVQAALSRALPDATSLIHFFDPSTNEFVVVCASGPWSSRALSMRTLHRQPPFSLLAGRQSP
jgi:hypothetical protein